MQQLFFVETGKVEWRDAPRPAVIDDEDALVRLIAVATCDVDTGLLFGAVPYEGPFPMGHEGVGEVVEVGDAVDKVSVGDRVIVPYQISCGVCHRCSRGLTASCSAVNPGAMYGLEPFGGPWGGFLGEAVRVPWANHMLVPLPQGVDPIAVASLSDNIVDGWRTVAPYVGDPANSSVLVIAGLAPSIPFYSVAVAKALGVPRVDYLAGGRALPSHAEKAARIGATVLDSDDEVETQRYTATVCSASDPTALDLAIRATEPDGTCFVNAIFFNDDQVPVPMFTMYTRNAALATGRVNARAAIPHALELITSGALHPESITDTTVDWDDAAEALMSGPQKLVFHR